jgi:hypothetical protein
MGKFEKFFVIFSLLYIMIYSVFFFNAMSTPENFEKILPFHFFGMALSLGFIIIVIRDIVKRTFKNQNSKILWSLLVIMFWPSVFIYLPKYAFRSRDEIQEPGNNKKYIIGSIAIVVIFFGYMGYSMYSVIHDFEKNFENQGNSLSSLASSGNNEKIITLLNNDTNYEIAIDGEGSWSPLHSASSNNHPSTVKLLIDRGASINKQSECNGNTPLHTAASNGYFEVVKVLVDSGADKTILNNENKTPKDLAEEGGYPATAEYLSAQ